MRNLFEHTSASWVRYSEYEWRLKGGLLYLMPSKDAKPTPYDPMKNPESLVLDAIDIGVMCLENTPKEEIQEAIRSFAKNYGLLGIMTALPTTAHFVEYEKVYLPHNQCIRTEAMETDAYIDLFFPFDTPDFTKRKDRFWWNVNDDRIMIALAMTYHDSPQAQVMSFMRWYGERYDWLVTVFKDWAFTFTATFLYYSGQDALDEESADLYRKGMAAFEGNAPTYHLELREHPTLVWDFHSLLVNIKMLFTFMLTDDMHPLRLCKQCLRAFIAPNAKDEFCSEDCRKRFQSMDERFKS